MVARSEVLRRRWAVRNQRLENMSLVAYQYNLVHIFINIMLLSSMQNSSLHTVLILLNLHEGPRVYIIRDDPVRIL